MIGSFPFVSNAPIAILSGSSLRFSFLFPHETFAPESRAQPRRTRALRMRLEIRYGRLLFLWPHDTHHQAPMLGYLSMLPLLRWIVRSHHSVGQASFADFGWVSKQEVGLSASVDTFKTRCSLIFIKLNKVLPNGHKDPPVPRHPETFPLKCVPSPVFITFRELGHLVDAFI